MLKHKGLMTAMIVILAAGFIATSLIGYTVSRAAIRSEITSSSLPLTSDNIYSEIQRDLLQPVFISSLMAHDTFVRDWVIKGEKNEPEITRYLQEIKLKYGTITTFFVSDRTLNYYHAEGVLKRVSPDEKRDAWYYRVKEMKDPYEINIDADMGNKDTMTIFINYKVFDYQNRFIGATGVGLTVTAVKDLINSYQNKYNRNIFFVDTKGLITLRSEAFPESAESIQQIEGIKNHASEILSSAGGTFSYKRKSSGYFLNTRYIKDFNWYLLVEENEEESAQILFRTLLLNILISLIITGIIFFLLRRQIQAYQYRIEHLASTDKLTGLFNRQAFDGIMEQALKEKRRTHGDIALLMLDLDFFKRINDTYGHLCGDSVLIQATQRIKTVLRESDPLCRWGGEEFFVLMKGCGREDARSMAEKIRCAFEAKPFIVKAISVTLTVSLGITLFSEEDTYETAVARADAALYIAKESGRNRAEFV